MSRKTGLYGQVTNSPRAEISSEQIEAAIDKYLEDNPVDGSKVYTTLQELGLDANATVEDVINEMPNGSIALINAGSSDFANYKTIFPYKTNDDNYARLHIVKGGSNARVLVKWFRKDGTREAIAYIDGNDKITGWNEPTVGISKTYTKLEELDLDGNASVDDVLAKLKAGEGATLNTASFNNYQTIFPYSEQQDGYATVRIVKGYEASRTIIKWVRKDAAKFAYGGLDSNNKVQNWSVFQAKEPDNTLYKVFNNQGGSSAKWFKVTNAPSQDGKSYTARLHAQRITHTGHIEYLSIARESGVYAYTGMIEMQEKVASTGALPDVTSSSFMVVDANNVLWIRVAAYSYAKVEIFTPNTNGSFSIDGAEGTPAEAYKFNMLSKRKTIGLQELTDVLGTMQTITGEKIDVETSKNNSTKTIASITLEKGIYDVVCSAFFPNNSNIGSYRRICLVTQQDTSSSALGVTSSCAPATGIPTSIQIHSIMNITSQTTYHLNAQHDAGATLNCQGFIRAVRII